MEKPPILNKEQLMKLAEKEREILDWQGRTVSDFITTKQRDADVEYYAQAIIAERKRLANRMNMRNVGGVNSEWALSDKDYQLLKQGKSPEEA